VERTATGQGTRQKEERGRGRVTMTDQTSENNGRRAAIGRVGNRRVGTGRRRKAPAGANAGRRPDALPTAALTRVARVTRCQLAPP
jgi:hypothetical protein